MAYSERGATLNPVILREVFEALQKAGLDFTRYKGSEEAYFLGKETQQAMAILKEFTETIEARGARLGG